MPTSSLDLFIRDDDSSVGGALGGKFMPQVQGAPHLFAPHHSGHTPSGGQFLHPERP